LPSSANILLRQVQPLESRLQRGKASSH
jgi:hypothetical protein